MCFKQNKISSDCDLNNKNTDFISEVQHIVSATGSHGGVVFLISYKKPGIMMKYFVKGIGNHPIKPALLCNGKKAWPRDILTAIWLYNNAVVCRYLTQGHAGFPFKSQVQFSLEYVLVSSNGRPIKSINCFALRFIDKVHKENMWWIFLFPYSKSISQVGTCWLWTVMNNTANILGDSDIGKHGGI